MMLLNNAFKVILADVTSNPFLFNDYKKVCCSFWFEFLQQCLLVQKGYVQDLLYRHLMHAKSNHSTLLALTLLFISTNFKATLS